jgi:hypothetical protein
MLELLPLLLSIFYFSVSVQNSYRFSISIISLSSYSPSLGFLNSSNLSSTYCSSSDAMSLIDISFSFLRSICWNSLKSLCLLSARCFASSFRLMCLILSSRSWAFEPRGRFSRRGSRVLSRFLAVEEKCYSFDFSGGFL